MQKILYYRCGFRQGLQCTRLIEVNMIICRRVDFFVGIKSTFLDIRSTLLDVRSTLLDIRSTLLDVWSTFVDIS